MTLRLDNSFLILFQLFEDLLTDLTEALKADYVIYLGFLVNIPLVNVLDLDVTKCDSC
jgi:hypothetical protein